MKSIKITSEEGSMYINDPMLEDYKFPFLFGGNCIYTQFTSHPNIVHSISMDDAIDQMEKSPNKNFWDDVPSDVSEGMEKTADADDIEEVVSVDGVAVIRKHPAGAVVDNGGMNNPEEVSV